MATRAADDFPAIARRQKELFPPDDGDPQAAHEPEGVGVTTTPYYAEVEQPF